MKWHRFRIARTRTYKVRTEQARCIRGVQTSPPNAGQGYRTTLPSAAPIFPWPFTPKFVPWGTSSAAMGKGIRSEALLPLAARLFSRSLRGSISARRGAVRPIVAWQLFPSPRGRYSARREAVIPLAERPGGGGGSSSSVPLTFPTRRRCLPPKAKPNGSALGCLDGPRTARRRGGSSHCEGGRGLLFGNGESRWAEWATENHGVFVDGIHMKWNFFVIFSIKWETLELDPRLFVEYSQRV